MDVGGTPFRTDSLVYGASEVTLKNGPNYLEQQQSESGHGGEAAVLNSGTGLCGGIDGYSGFGGDGDFNEGGGFGSSTFEEVGEGEMDLAMYAEGNQFQQESNGNVTGQDNDNISGGMGAASQYFEVGSSNRQFPNASQRWGGENMEVDERPQFTIELELYFDLNKDLVFGADLLGNRNGISIGSGGNYGANNETLGFVNDGITEDLVINPITDNTNDNMNTIGATQDTTLFFVGSGMNYQVVDSLGSDPIDALSKEFHADGLLEHDFLRKHGGDENKDVLPLPQLQQYALSETQLGQSNQTVDIQSKQPFFTQQQLKLQLQLLKLQLSQHHNLHFQQDQRRDSLNEHLGASLLLHGPKRNSLVLDDERGGGHPPHSNSVLSQHSQHHARYKNQLHRESIDSLTLSLHLQDNPQIGNFNELSPLTTTTSLTPSVSSMHSTQPSFLSAQQFFSRNSFEQMPPAPSSTRGSLDLYPKNRQSIDSQQSGNRRGRYTDFTTSFYNYFPFRSDRNQQLSPVSNSSSPNSPGDNLKSPKETQPPPQQSRMLIRSIFRSQNNGEDVTIPRPLEDDLEQPDFLLKNEDGGEPSGSNKKVKKPRRGLFMRFKPVPKDQVMEDGGVVTESRDSESLDNSNKSISKISSNGDIAPTILSDKAGNNTNNNTIKEEPDDKSWEPDYAALFQKVGRRKVYPSYKKTNTKLGTKSSQENINGSLQNSIGSGESSSQGMTVSMSNEAGNAKLEEDDGRSSIAESHSSRNTDLSGMEQILGTSETSQSNGSTLATASKRILGSKLLLMKKTKDASAATLASVDSQDRSQNEEGVEVEVDLSSLKLPANTQVYQTVKSKSKTRGRKENKQADMVDSSKIFLCNYCSRRFKRQEHLKRHFRSLHTCEKPYDCPHCHKKFSRLDNLNLHLKTHKREGEDDDIPEIPEESMDTDMPESQQTNVV